MPETVTGRLLKRRADIGRDACNTLLQWHTAASPKAGLPAAQARAVPVFPLCAAVGLFNSHLVGEPENLASRLAACQD